MNKGLALVALVLSIVALLVTSRQLWGGHEDDPSQNANAEDRLHKLNADLKRLTDLTEKANTQLQRIEGRLQGLEEGASAFYRSGARGMPAGGAGMQQLIKQLVRKEMDRRLASAPAKASAPKAKPAAPKVSTDKRFNDAVNSLIKSAALRGKEINLTRNAFTVCRGKLKAGQANYNRNRRKQGQRAAASKRDSEFKRSRDSLDTELKKVLSSTSFARYIAWKQKEFAKPGKSYVKTFYGKK